MRGGNGRELASNRDLLQHTPKAPPCCCIERRFLVVVTPAELRAKIPGGNVVAKGLCLMRDGQVLVDYGKRRVPISSAQYRANGYKPSCDKLPLEALPKAVAVAKLGPQ
jgi:hypothetical protein